MHMVSKSIGIIFFKFIQALHSLARGTCIALKNTDNYSFLMR